MKITAKTKVREVLPLLNEERIKAIADAVQPMALAKPLLSMTCGEFCQALTENYAMSFFGKDELAVVAFGRYKQYIAELESVTAYIKRFEVEQDGDEKAAAQGCRLSVYARTCSVGLRESIPPTQHRRG